MSYEWIITSLFASYEKSEKRFEDWTHTAICLKLICIELASLHIMFTDFLREVMETCAIPEFKKSDNLHWMEGQMITVSTILSCIDITHKMDFLIKQPGFPQTLAETLGHHQLVHALIQDVSEDIRQNPIFLLNATEQIWLPLQRLSPTLVRPIPMTVGGHIAPSIFMGRWFAVPQLDVLSQVPRRKLSGKLRKILDQDLSSLLGDWGQLLFDAALRKPDTAYATKMKSFDPVLKTVIEVMESSQQKKNLAKDASKNTPETGNNSPREDVKPVLAPRTEVLSSLADVCVARASCLKCWCGAYGCSTREQCRKDYPLYSGYKPGDDK